MSVVTREQDSIINARTRFMVKMITSSGRDLRNADINKTIEWGEKHGIPEADIRFEYAYQLARRFD